MPQGVLVERLRAVAAGMGAFYSPVAEDTVITEGKERREFGGQTYVLESPLRLDYALIYAHKADRAGNVSFRGTSQNFGPSFAKGAKVVIIEADELVEVGEIAPGEVDLPGIFVDRVVKRAQKLEPLWRIPREAGEGAHVPRPAGPDRDGADPAHRRPAAGRELRQPRGRPADDGLRSPRRPRCRPARGERRPRATGRA